jgi:4-hydroxy-3-methylbut-2-enyl diphosphate reductase
MLKLVDPKSAGALGEIKLVLVVGGFNSSNTGHLQEIGEARNLPSYHIDGPDCIGPGNLIRHKVQHASDLEETRDWLPEGDVVIGITSGASTPDHLVAAVLEKTFALSNQELD